jgi:type II secretory pathway component GspD/PulD (secretin)
VPSLISASSLRRCAALTATLSFVSSLAATSANAGGAQPRGTITLDAHDQPVREVLLRVGDLARLNVSIAEDVRGNINLTLHDATADDAFHTICGQLRLRCVRDGRTLIVRSASTAVVPLAIVSAQRAAGVLRALYPRLAVRADTAANAVVLDGSESDLQAAKTVIQGLDVRDATKPTTDALSLHTQNATVVAETPYRLSAGEGDGRFPNGAARLGDAA